jgi:hypothetical protein
MNHDRGLYASLPDLNDAVSSHLRLLSLRLYDGSVPAPSFDVIARGRDTVGKELAASRVRLVFRIRRRRGRTFIAARY